MSVINLLELVEQGRWLEYLREVYTPEPVPACRVCGAKLGVARMGGGDAAVWACTEAEPIKTGAWDHYRDSRWTQYRSGDTRVLALLDWVEADPARRDEAQAVLRDLAKEAV